MKEVIDDHDKFRAFVDAFLCHTRSITWVMKKEFGHSDDFDYWYCDQLDMMQKNTIFGFFKEMRNVSQKEGPIEARATANLPKNLTYKIKGEPETEPMPSIVNSTIERYRFFDNLPIPSDYRSTDAITLCEVYLQKLGTIVDDCEKKFLRERLTPC
jgi:hypothetical protein